MKVSFSDIANSEAYQAEAAVTAKANLFTVTAVAVLTMLFAGWGFGLWWFIIIPCLWWGSADCDAFLRVTAAAALSNRLGKAHLVSVILNTLNYVVVIAETYFGLRYLNELLF
jgi:hypothetical protein